MKRLSHGFLLRAFFGTVLWLTISISPAAGSTTIDLLEEARTRAGRGEDLQATPYYRQVLGLAEKELGESSVALSRLRLEVGALHLRQGRLDEARILFEHAASTFESSLGERDPQLALALAGLAAVNLKLGHDDEAKGFWARAREIVGGLQATPADSASVFSQVAPAVQSRSRQRDSPRALRRALDEAQAQGDVAAQISGWRRLGDLQLAQGQERRAADAYERALELQRGVDGAVPALVPRIDELSRVYRRLGALDSAVPWLELALQIEEDHLGSEDPRVADRLARLGLLHREAGRDDQADTYFRRAVAATDQWVEPEVVLAARPTERPVSGDPVLVVEDSGEVELPEPVATAEPVARAAEAAFEDPPEPDLPEGPRYWAQLASRQDATIARAELEALRRDLAPMLDGLPARVQAADLVGKGTWYRLQVGGFGSREEAVALCARLAASGHEGCWVPGQPVR